VAKKNTVIRKKPSSKAAVPAKSARKTKAPTTKPSPKPAAKSSKKAPNGVAKTKGKPAAKATVKVAASAVAAPAAKVVKPRHVLPPTPPKPQLIVGKSGGISVENLQIHGGAMSIAEWLGRPDREVLTETELRKVKTGLAKKDLDQYRQLLLEKRAEILGDVASMQTDAKTQSATVSYEHMADTGSDNYEQEFTLGLVESERKLLAQIDDALVRMQKGYYGVCVETAQPINRARLDAKPWAKYCIEVVREKERRGEM
jgi:RNA polymerase-binding protein DksA